MVSIGKSKTVYLAMLSTDFPENPCIRFAHCKAMNAPLILGSKNSASATKINMNTRLRTKGSGRNISNEINIKGANKCPAIKMVT